MAIESIKPSDLNNLETGFGYFPLEYACIGRNEHLCLYKYNEIPVAVFKIKISSYFRIGLIDHGPVICGTMVPLSELFTFIMSFWSLRAIKIRSHLAVNESNISEIYKLAQRFSVFSEFSIGNVWSTLLLNVKDLNNYNVIKSQYRKGLKSDLVKARKLGLFIRERDLNEIDYWRQCMGKDKRIIVENLLSLGYHGKLIVLEVVQNEEVLGLFIFHESNRIIRYFTGVVLTQVLGFPISHIALDYTIEKSVMSESIDSLDFWGYNLISLDKKILGINRFKSSFRGEEKVFLPAIRLSSSRLGRLMLWSV
jgi:hypothetical protein